MEVDNTYKYKDKRPHPGKAQDLIRLIHLEPSQELESGIECKLHHTTLSSHKYEYIAVSYVWGDASDKRSITVNGKRLDITASLECALRHIRDSSDILLIWADGICINQNDVQDRNEQVPLMGDIYYNARTTTIFLGLSSWQIDHAMRFMASYGESENGLITAAAYEEFWQGTLVGNVAVVEQEILARPWFTRVWILQEFILSRDPWLQCGRSRIRWQRFFESVTLDGSARWAKDSRTIVKSMNDSRQRFRETNASDNWATVIPEVVPDSYLLELLCARRGCQLSDPRDMVYAHLGLASARIRKAIPIDYSKTVAHLFEDVSRFYMMTITSTSVQTMLSFVEQSPNEQRGAAHPSWVPDWSSEYQPGSSDRPTVPKDLQFFESTPAVPNSS